MHKFLIYFLSLVIALFQIVIISQEAYAGSSTANATAGTGDYVYSVITDSGGHFVGRFGLCDGTAAASCATITGGVLSTSAAQSGTWNITNISGTISLPTGAATSALQSTIISTLGSPFQAGGSIGNTSFAATQATASSLNATVVGTGTFAVQAAQSGTWNITNISGTVSLPTGAATSANQTNASQKTQIVDGSGNVIASTSNNLNVQCANCSGSGASAADAATFTAGTSTFAPAGGQFTSGGATACVTGHQCLVGITSARAFLTDMSSISGTTTLTGNGTTGAGSLRVTVASDNTAFTVNAAQSGTWNITNISGTVSLPTGAATSANQTNASQKTQIVDGSGNVIASTSNNLNVQCANCSGSGVSAADAATFTAGTSLMAPIGAQFTSGGATACVTGHECTLGMTAARGLFTDVSSIAGTTTLTGNGTTGAGSQRVTIASDNTAFSVNATLQASATTAIGKVDPNTIANWGLVVSTQNSTTPTNGVLVVGQFNTTPTTITSGNVSPLQMDNAGNLLVNIKAGGGSGGTSIADNAAFTTGTTLETPISCYAGTPTATANHSTIIACTTGGSVHTTVDNTNSNGQATMANSSPVVIASNQSSLTVNGGAASGSAVSGNPILIGGSDGTDARTLLMSSTGQPHIICDSGCSGSGGTSSSFGSAFPSVGTAIGLTNGTNMVAWSAASNYGTSPGAIAVPAVNASVTNTIAANITQVAGSTISATNPLFTNISVGSAAISATNGLYTNVLQGNAVLSITNPIFVRNSAGATGGASTAGAIVPNNTTAVVVKASAGTLYGLQLYGINAAPLYVKFYNATSATCGSGTPVKRLMIPANGTAANGAGSNVTFGDVGVNFSTGITYCATTGIADNDTTAPTANNFLINVDYN